ncbi:hypothetical protein [Mastigocoleus testarum]|uniref:Uncharacterized protein n=1 Tax=Mastigocoleus testarum BC008 TaxID=371196 RepID=A0A0V7ZHP7_9CYAN|nr:hypothetical protein [Mastigocoleus testarum]KST64083.1 hypothetical protein BC008_40530 [Mastigocoleus testarum BC008]KST64793.1 hypothetical protein BC008_41505 [Mastigocoleus testarum BC008]
MTHLETGVLVLQIVEMFAVFYVNQCVQTERKKTVFLKRRVNRLKECEMLIRRDTSMKFTELIKTMLTITEAIKNIAEALDKIPDDNVEAKASILSMNDIQDRLVKIEQDNLDTNP